MAVPPSTIPSRWQFAGTSQFLGQARTSSAGSVADLVVVLVVDPPLVLLVLAFVLLPAVCPSAGHFLSSKLAMMAVKPAVRSIS